MISFAREQLPFDKQSASHFFLFVKYKMFIVEYGQIYELQILEFAKTSAGKFKIVKKVLPHMQKKMIRFQVMLQRYA